MTVELKKQKRQSRTRQGYAFEHEILTSVKAIKETTSFSDLWFFKLVDTHSYDWVKAIASNNLSVNIDIDKTNKPSQNLVIPKVPSDFIAIMNGKAVFLECKSSKDIVGFPIANVKDHQLSMASDIRRAGSRYYFLICNRQPRRNLTYVIESEVLSKLIAASRNGKLQKTKIAWVILGQYSIFKIPKSGSMFDLKPLFSYLFL